MRPSPLSVARLGAEVRLLLGRARGPALRQAVRHGGAAVDQGVCQQKAKSPQLPEVEEKDHLDVFSLCNMFFLFFKENTPLWLVL